MFHQYVRSVSNWCQYEHFCTTDIDFKLCQYQQVAIVFALVDRCIWCKMHGCLLQQQCWQKLANYSVVNIIDITMTLCSTCDKLYFWSWYPCVCKVPYSTIGISGISCDLWISYHTGILLNWWITNETTKILLWMSCCSYTVAISSFVY